MKQVLFFLFIFSLNTFSQSIEIKNFESLNQIHFMEDELYVFYKDSLSIIDLNKFKIKSTSKVNYPPENFTYLYNKVDYNSQLYFIQMEGGMVYKFKINEFTRIDKSFNHKMQNGSTIFAQNDTIFKYGGYGFWSMRNFFTYFNSQTSEWDIVSPSGSKYLPKGSSSSIVNLNENNFYVYGGSTLNPFEPKEYILNDEVWKFNIKNKSWNFLGKTDMDFSKFEFNFPFKDKQVFYTRDDIIYVVDVVNNRLKAYKKKTFQYGLMTSFYNKGIFYSILISYSTGTQTLTKRYEDDFFGELIDEEPLYYNNEKIYYSIGIIILLLFSIYLYFQVKKSNFKRNRIISENNHFVFKRKILPFDDKCIEIIKLLLQSTSEVTLNEIMEVYENKKRNYGHNTRVINGLIEEVNYKLKSTLGIERDLITSHKSSSDKRIKVYSIDKTYFFIK